MKTLYEWALKSGVIQGDEKKTLGQAVIIKADNVSEYIEMSKDGWCGPEDLPNIAPPFGNFWIEMAAFIGRSGTVDGGIEKIDPIFGIHALWVVSVPNFITHDGWISRLTLFQQAQGVPQKLFDCALWIASDGKPIDREPPREAYLALNPTDGNVETLRPMVRAMGGTVWSCLLAVAFMHCKNVEMAEHSPHLKPTGSRNRHGPHFKYYTLNIDPMKKVLRTEGNSETAGLKKALHICRGHFAHYGPDNRLFGKLEGDFWIPMHTRGSIEQGAVVKDYAVKAKTDD